MSSAMIYKILGFILLITAIWFYISSVIIMFKRDKMLGLFGIILPPWAELIFFFSKRATLSPKEQKTLIGCFVSLILCAGFLVYASLYLPVSF